MALLFADGFDLYSNVADVHKSGFGRRNTSAGFLPNGGRFGGGCLTMGTSDLQGWYLGCDFVPGNTMILAFAYYHSATQNTTPNSVFVEMSRWKMYLSGIGTLQFIDDSNTAKAVVTNAIPQNQWCWVEIKVFFGTTATNGTAQVRVNENLIMDLNTLDTFGTASSHYNDIYICGPGGIGSTMKMDDILLLDGSGGENNNFLGDTRIDTLLPNGDGGVTAWTASSGANYECVDDPLGAANDDTDYIASTTAGQESRFTFQDLTSTPSGIDAVQVRARGRKDNAGSRTFRALINSGASEATGPTLGLSTDYVWTRGGIFSLNPNGNVPWNTAAVNALEAGIEVVS